MKAKISFALALIVCSSLLSFLVVQTAVAQRRKGPKITPPPGDLGAVPQPMPSLIPFPTPSPTPTGYPSSTPTVTITPKETPKATATPQGSPSPSPTPSGSATPTPGEDNQCCGAKPSLKGIAAFTGEIAVATNQVEVDTEPSVVIWDLTNQNVATVPKGSQWSSTSVPQTNRYFHPDWVRKKIGDVFGLTLDSTGNIYVAASRVYGTNKVGSPMGGSAGNGDIYKLDASSGVATRFMPSDSAVNTYTGNNKKIPNTGPGLGNIHYSCKYDRIYATDFEDGMIYCIDPTGGTGTIKSFWDHGGNLGTIIDTKTNGFTPLGRRPFAVQTKGSQLFYSVWVEDAGRPDPNKANEIWSIGLDGSGNFTGVAKLEVTVPPLPGTNYSNPVADISFSSNRMLLSERGMGSDISPVAHQSRVIEYVGPAWVPSAATFGVGQLTPQRNAAGGCDYGAIANHRVWFTGDYLTTTPGVVYGIQGTPDTGGTYLTSILIDLDTILGTQDKRHIGDVEIPCLGEAQTPECSAVAKEIICKKDGSGYTVNLVVTNNTGQPATDILLASPPGSSYTVTPAHAGPLADHTSINVSVTITGGKPGDKACFTVTLMGKDGCLCTIEVCPVLPDCCALLNNDATKILCNNDGTFTYTTTITNNSGSPKYFIYLYPPPGVTMTPDHFTITQPGGLPPGGVFQTPPIIIKGNGEVCFDISLHNKGMEGCCLSPHHCIRLDPCK